MDFKNNIRLSKYLGVKAPNCVTIWANKHVSIKFVSIESVSLKNVSPETMWW
jgi:hypothetical protein